MTLKPFPQNASNARSSKFSQSKMNQRNTVSKTAKQALYNLTLSNLQVVPKGAKPAHIRGSQ